MLALLLAHLRRLRGALLPVPVLCGRCSQPAELLTGLRRSAGAAWIRVLRRHHVRVVHVGICRVRLLPVVLLMVLRPAVPRAALGVVLRRRRHLLVLVLRTRGRAAEGYLRRRLLVLLVLLLVLRRRRDREGGGGRGVGGLGRAGARVALGGGATASALLAGAGGGLFVCLVFVFFGGRTTASNG